jgi:hypothetical protein
MLGNILPAAIWQEKSYIELKAPQLAGSFISNRWWWLRQIIGLAGFGKKSRAYQASVPWFRTAGLRKIERST